MPSIQDGRDEAVDQPRTREPPFGLAAAAADLYADLRPDRALQRLLAHTSRLTGSVAGAVSVVEPDGQRYTKAAERGVTCQVGCSFPLDEGATGRAVAMRGPVVLDDYALLPTRHVTGRGPAGHRAVLAVPIWWRGEVVAVNVAFRPPRARFTSAEVDQLEALSQSAATAIVHGRRDDPSLGGLLRARAATGERAVTVTETGAVHPVADDLAQAAADLLVALGGIRGGADARPLQVAVVHHTGGVRLLVQQESADGSVDAWSDALRGIPFAVPDAAGVHVERVPGWGMALRADLPHDPTMRAAAAMPFTPRERQVLVLIQDGLTDREVGARLGVSPKTVEKHVGAILRKARARSRAAAVATALERGWL